MSDHLKLALYEHCERFLNSRLLTIQSTIFELQNALQSETKSSAGDKHETGRAMVQLEREKAGQQLAQIQQQFRILNKIKQSKSTAVIGLGSVVITSRFNYFIAVSVGEVSEEKETYYAISPQTPIAQLMLGKKVGDKVQFRSDTFEILQVR